jgi:hypothetical protein
MTIRTALDAFAPELTAQFTSFATRRIERLIEQFGLGLRGIGNSGQYKSYEAVAGLFDRYTGEIRADRLEAAAAAYAAATIEAWAAKIDQKIGDLIDAEVRALDGARFRIVGIKNDRSICIEQDRIVNVSPKGTLFNQFPARIYVNGKFTSAAAYAKL